MTTPHSVIAANRAASPVRRRTLLAASGALAIGTALPAGDHTAARAVETTDSSVAALERRHGRIAGVYARNLRTGRALSHRPDRAMPMCSLFKVITVGAVLSGELVVPERRVLERPVHLPPAALVENSPYVEECFAAGRIPTVADLCRAALQRSDNTAGNALLSLIGGPAGLTRSARGLGDDTTRLDRWEPELNSAEPDRRTDTTSARAIAQTYSSLVLESALPVPARRRLRTWMLGNTTSGGRLGKALPPGWRLADKTGAGAYGVVNDAGVAWSPDGTPVLLSVLTRSRDAGATNDNELVAEIGRLCFDRLT
jgi:beta-lactamase class A